MIIGNYTHKPYYQCDLSAVRRKKRNQRMAAQVSLVLAFALFCTIIIAIRVETGL